MRMKEKDSWDGAGCDERRRDWRVPFNGGPDCPPINTTCSGDARGDIPSPTPSVRSKSAGAVVVCGAHCNCLYNRGSAQMQALCACIGDLFDLLSPWLNSAQPYLTGL